MHPNPRQLHPRPLQSSQASYQLPLADIIAEARRGGADIGGPPPPPGGAGMGAAEVPDPGGGSSSSVFSSVEKLGLKLNSTTAPIQQLFVDHAKKTPTED